MGPGMDMPPPLFSSKPPDIWGEKFYRETQGRERRCVTVSQYWESWENYSDLDIQHMDGPNTARECKALGLSISMTDLFISYYISTGWLPLWRSLAVFGITSLSTPGWALSTCPGAEIQTALHSNQNSLASHLPCSCLYSFGWYIIMIWRFPFWID